MDNVARVTKTTEQKLDSRKQREAKRPEPKGLVSLSDKEREKALAASDSLTAADRLSGDNALLEALQNQLEVSS